jgi:hypothetical protein
MKTCPDCAKFYSGFKCSCGYKEPYKSKQGFVSEGEDNHPDANKCLWEDRGMRCQRLGTMSTHPHAGGVRPIERRPFYCPWHFEQLTNPHFASDKDSVDQFFTHMKRYPREVKLSDVQ